MTPEHFELKRGRHTRLLEGRLIDYIFGLHAGYPAVMPTEGHIFDGVFYGRARSPLGWHSVKMPINELRVVL